MSRHLRAPDEIPVVFRYKPPASSAPPPFVDLRGDLIHWSHIERLSPAGEGWLESTLHLAPGAYTYKLHVGGGAWILDPHNPRTRSRDGVQNSLLLVGGTEEPVLHVPARPWLFLDDEGAVRLRAGLRKGAGERLAVRWDEGEGRRETALAVVASEDEHLLFEAKIPASARSLEYAFAIPDGRVIGRAGGAGQALVVPLASLRSRAPSWLQGAVIYTVFVDRFRRAGGAWGELADDKARAGGDLDGVREALPHLVDLGVNTIHLTPVALAPSAHRYDAIDPRVVDPAIGGEAALVRLFEAAHRLDLRVLLDVTLTHVHMDFEAFRDLRERGPRSPFLPWFHVKYWPFPDGPDGGYLHYQKGQWREPLLRTEEPEVIAYLAETFARWARLGADGFRVDAAADVPLALLRAAVEAARAVKPEVAFIGEVVPDNLARFTSALDAATDFPAQEALLDLIARGRAGAARTAERLAQRRFDRGAARAAIAFTATHDQHRLLTLTRDARAARLGQLLVLLGAASPALYYGDEIGLSSNESPAREFDDAWPDRAPMPWDRARWDEATRSLVREALRLRREHAAIGRGDEAHLALPDGGDRVLLLRRTFGGDVVDVIAHAGEGDREVALPGGAPSGARVLLALGEATLAGERLRLGAWSAAVLARVPSEEARAAFATIAGSARALSLAAFRAGITDAPLLPAHLYLTVTERCNLRCAHCITDAPAKTAEGRARQMAPWILLALREVFAAASYFGFVHGGEALTAPIFPEVLRAIQRARAGASGATHVHVLSNGMLLDGEATRRLVDLGVTSLAVSLDGASELTNDRLRVGGRFATIVGNLRAVIAARAALGADLRVGVSTVVTASNVRELPALGRLVAEVGADWLKVEEIFPCTPTARRELIFPREPEVEEAMRALHEAVAGAKVRVVDHRDPPAGCGCRAKSDPALAAFRAADDFANRAVFQPCRAEWEQACVDPDGVVRAVDYSRPALGCLSERSFVELWNGEGMRKARAAALGRTPAAMRRGCGG